MELFNTDEYINQDILRGYWWWRKVPFCHESAVDMMCIVAHHDGLDEWIPKIKMQCKIIFEKNIKYKGKEK